MRLRRVLLVAAVGLVGVPAMLSGRAAAPAWIDGRAVVGYESERALEQALTANPARVLRRLPALRAVEVRPYGRPAAFASALRSRPGISFVSPLRRQHLAAEPGISNASTGLPGGAHEWQWFATRQHLVGDDVRRAAARVTIAVVDSGADLSAPDVGSRSPVTWNAVDGSADVTDDIGHGTFVASIAAGDWTNGEGVSGFGGDAKLMVVKITASLDGSILDVDAAAGIVWAVDHGAKVINASFGGPDVSPVLSRAIDYAVKKGALVVVAAGNSFAAGNPIFFPAALAQPVSSSGLGGAGLAVAATNSRNATATFSEAGDYISLAAPGENVFGALSVRGLESGLWSETRLPGSRQGRYGYSSGTSFAAPQVAGAAALVWGANPSLTAAQVAGILKFTAETGKPAGTWNERVGFGLLDVHKAVSKAQAWAASPPKLHLEAGRKGRYVWIGWSGDQAVHYRLLVEEIRAGGSRGTRVLIADTAARSTTYKVEPGAVYRFTAQSFDGLWTPLASKTVTVSFRQARAALSLAASATRGAKPLRVTLTARLRGERGLRVGGRTLSLQSFDGVDWRRVAGSRTRADGTATWTFVLRRPGDYRLRARLAPSDEVAGATSGAVSVTVRG